MRKISDAEANADAGRIEERNFSDQSADLTQFHRSVKNQSKIGHKRTKSAKEKDASTKCSYSFAPSVPFRGIYFSV
jgi:hypothetical protein